MGATLGQWHENSRELMTCIRGKLASYKQQSDAALKQQKDLEAKVESVKATLRAQQEADPVGFGSADFDGSMEYEDDKMRKSGRAKSKHAMGLGPRK